MRGPGLGIIGTRDTAPVLTEILMGNNLGAGSKPVTRRMRALAAHGLGVIGRRASAPAVRAYCVYHLASAMATADTTSSDLGVACALSIGLVRLEVIDEKQGGEESAPSSSRQAQVGFLLEQFSRDDLSEIVRSYIPRAMARLAVDVPDLRRDLVRTLSARLAPSAKESQTVRFACILALGRIGNASLTTSDVEARKRLFNAAKEGQVQERGLALIALGQIAGRGGDDSEGRIPREMHAYLIGRVGASRSTERPWAALAVGLLEWGRSGNGQEVSQSGLKTLRDALTKVKNPDEAGSLCIALGLAGDQSATELLIERASKGDESIRGQAITALGMLGALDAVPLLRFLALDGRHPSLAREAAIALGLMRDRQIRQELIPDAKLERFQSHQITALLSLAYAGDALVIRDVGDILLSKRSSETVRAYAAIALGIIADKDLEPWNHPIAADVNYWQGPSLLFDPETGRGVVDLF